MRGSTNHMPTHVLAVADSGTTALRSSARVRMPNRATGSRLRGSTGASKHPGQPRTRVHVRLTVRSVTSWLSLVRRLKRPSWVACGWLLALPGPWTLQASIEAAEPFAGCDRLAARNLRAYQRSTGSRHQWSAWPCPSGHRKLGLIRRGSPVTARHFRVVDEVARRTTARAPTLAGWSRRWLDYPPMLAGARWARILRKDIAHCCSSLT